MNIKKLFNDTVGYGHGNYNISKFVFLRLITVMALWMTILPTDNGKSLIWPLHQHCWLTFIKTMNIILTSSGKRFLTPSGNPKWPPNIELIIWLMIAIYVLVLHYMIPSYQLLILQSLSNFEGKLQNGCHDIVLIFKLHIWSWWFNLCFVDL